MNKVLIAKSQCEKCHVPIILKGKRKYFLCVNCRTQVVLKGKLEILKKTKLEDEYSQYLYDLYLRYMERYLLSMKLWGKQKDS